MNFQSLDKFSLPVGFRGRNFLIVQAWWFVSATLFSMSPQFMYGWRAFLLRAFGAKVGRGVIIRPSVKVTYPWKLVVGDYAWIGDEVVLYSLGEITIGAHAVVSQRSYLCTGSHDYSVKSFDIYAKNIVVEAEAWVATDVFIGPGVTIGYGAIVGARSTVLTNMPSGMICLGSPAKPIKPRLMKS